MGRSAACPADVTHQRVVREESCSVAAVRRVAAMLDLDPDAWSQGDVLPRGWQFVLLGADTPRSALRSDGYPGLGVPVPDLGLPRLMIVGRSVRYHGDIRLGASLRRESGVTGVTRKDGPRGPMAILTVEHVLYPTDGTEPLLTESQTFVLLGAAAPARAGESEAGPPLPPRRMVVTPDDTLLFQYSALGFNSHRIHWDRAFARETEGFPDLVVNGGLTSLLLTEFLRTGIAGTPSSLTARYVAPLFCDRPVTLACEPRDGGWTLRAFDDAGRVAVEIEAEAEAEAQG